MKDRVKEFEISGVKGAICIRRMNHGHPHISAGDELDLFFGLGYAHGCDRQMQMWVVKLLGQGRASECLRGDAELIETDKFMRWLNLAGDAAVEAEKLAGRTRDILEAYCEGVNAAVLATRRPLAFKLVGYTPDRWTPADALLVAKLMGFVGLSQSQGEAEKFIVQLIQNGLDAERLRELFPPIQETIAEEYVHILRQVNLVHPQIPDAVPWAHLLPNLSASNNWAIAPDKTASGKAMLCGDPHLYLQLPAVWYLATLTCDAHYLMGATVPGLPIVAAGRSPHLAWSPTYGTADVSDYFIEEVRAGRYRRGDEWVPLQVREETIRPKKKQPMTLRVFETEHGILEGNPAEDGHYLCFAWTGKQQKDTAVQSLENMLDIHRAKDAEAAIDRFAGLAFGAFNWVFADREGNIGYQLSGLAPGRLEGTSGLLPYLGWDRSQDWDGMVDSKQYPRVLNPESGFIVTANQDLNHLGQHAVMNLPMSDYRADRICDLLREDSDFTTDDMKRMHYDRYALQAEAFMEIIRPLLPNSEWGDLLRAWDCRYTADSKAATLFDLIYRELLMLVFGENGLGLEVMACFMNRALLNMLHGNFDRILLSDTSAWFDGQSREALYRTAIARGLDRKDIRPHGETRRVYVENLFFGGKLPRFLGFDRALSLVGSRSTIAQTGITAQGRRRFPYAPTLRLICDFADGGLHINLAGGASDRRFSKFYASGIREWDSGEYEVFEP